MVIALGISFRVEAFGIFIFQGKVIIPLEGWFLNARNKPT